MLVSGLPNNFDFSNSVLEWYHKYGRKNLPWQTDNPYHVWVSEVMLQQTQVVKVIDYFNRFIQQFPSLKALASAQEQQVLAMWSGLGYYNRARYLHRAANICCDRFSGVLPSELNDLMGLPGIGRSTAGAIMSLAYNKPVSILDGNVKRFFSRCFTVNGSPNQGSTLKKLWVLADRYISDQQPKQYNQALMDIGSMVCTRRQPKCDVCPVQSVCFAYKKDVVNQYPQPRKSVTKKNMQLSISLTIHNNKIYLIQRDSAGIWPELWFLPAFECTDRPADMVVQHILTHRNLLLEVYIVNYENMKESSYGCWINIDNLKNYPHPVALNKILRNYEDRELH